MWCKLSNSTIEKLNCCKCNHVLSVPPVKSTKSGFVCGRCPSEGERNTAFEVLAENFLFPCKYKALGCGEVHPFQTMANHERICPKRPYMCPNLPKGICLWRGLLSDISSHLKDKHEDIISDCEVIQIDLRTDFEICKILIKTNACYALDLFYDKNKGLMVNLMKIGFDFWKKYEKYELKLKSLDLTQDLVLTSRKISYYLSKRDSLNSEGLWIDRNSLSFFKEEKLYLEIKFLSNYTRTEPNVLKLLECPICTDYMKAAIFQCKTGHSFCELCTKRLSNCPFCSKQMTGTVNYGLMSLAEQLHVPCKNQNSRCDFTGLLPELLEHEKKCVLYKCPLKLSKNCDFIGVYTDLIEHSKNFHKFFNADTYNVRCALNMNKKVIFRLMCAFDAVFLSCRKFENDKLYWSIQFVGPKYAASQFTYIIEFIGDFGKKMVFSDTCKEYAEGEKVFKDCLIIPNYQLSDFVTKNYCVNNVRIVKTKEVD